MVFQWKYFNMDICKHKIILLEVRYCLPLLLLLGIVPSQPQQITLSLNKPHDNKTKINKQEPFCFGNSPVSNTDPAMYACTPDHTAAKSHT